MMTVVEKMAKAMFPWAWDENADTPWDYNPARDQTRAKEKALAALRALREPSEGMVDAAYSGATADKVWRAMIDAAIHEAETA